MFSFSRLNRGEATAMTIAVASIAIVIIFLFVPVDRYDTGQVKITIGEGSSLNSIAGQLSDTGLIRSKPLFILYVRALGEGNTLQAGDYIFSKSFSTAKIASMLAQGLAANDIQITVPEGSNIWQVDEILAQAGLIARGTFAAKFYGNEGYLFPDTYRFKKNPVAAGADGNRLDEVYNKMTANFNGKTGGISKKQKEIVIIASILEKEARTENDMRIVSGIIQKRIKMNIPLQIDATVAYGACLRRTRDCDVTQIGVANEINIDGPYNTYTKKGLPAGPISNPGLTALNAALHPIGSDYLYYLSTRDGSQIIYAKTPAEQAVNRRKYLGL